MVGMRFSRFAIGMALALLPAFSGRAVAQGHTIFDGFVVLNLAGGGNTFFDTDLPTPNADFTGVVASISAGQSLLLGGEVETGRAIVNAQEVAADSAAIHYAFGSNAFAALNLPGVPGPAPDRWEQTNVLSMAEIGTLAVGIHTMRVRFSASDAGHPVAPGYTTYLPPAGAFTALVEVTAAPSVTVSFACDDASDPGYAGGWTNGSTGGAGFGPWTLLTLTDPDGAAGSFRAVNDTGAGDNDDMNYVGSGLPPRGWGLFANESGTGGDDVQIAAGFRALDQVLATGQAFRIRFEHGGIQGGSLSANNPPRTGGWVGFMLRNLPPGQQNDPDPFDPLGALAHAVFGFGFKGGNDHYTLYDVGNPSGLDTGIPFTPNGIELGFMLRSPTTYDLLLRSLGPDAWCTTISNRALVGAAIQYAAVYNRNAEEADAFFNMMKVEPAPLPATNLLAYDDAAAPAYDPGWQSGQNGGFGFEPWSFFTNQGAGGAAGHFTASNPPNTDLNGIASGGRGWGMFAKDDTGGGVQVASAFRQFTGGDLRKGEAFSVQLEHGGIAALNGQVRFILYGTATFSNPMGEVFRFEFLGGGTNYIYTDSLLTARPSGMPWTDGGLTATVRLQSDAASPAYELTVQPAGGVKRIFTGHLESAPNRVRLEIFDVEDDDVFWNRLAILPPPDDLDRDGLPNTWEQVHGTNPYADDAAADDDGDTESNLGEFIADTDPRDSNDFFTVESFAVMSPATLAFETATGRLYRVEYDDNLLTADDWQALTSNVPGTGGAVLVSDGAETNQRSYRVQVQMAP